MTHDNQRTQTPMPSQKLASALNDFLHQSRDNAQTPQATQPAEVTDEQILTEAARHLGEMHVENAGIGDILSFARAILALRPVQVPMTDGEILHQLNNISDRIGSVTRLPKGWLEFARAIEEWHGITAQAKKEAL